MLELEATLTHILSQLIYRWIPLPGNLSSTMPRAFRAQPESLDPLALSPGEWNDFIDWKRSSSTSPWLSHLDQQLSGYQRVLIHELIHFRDRLIDSGADYLTYYSADYPECLRQIPDAPAAFSLYGDKALLRQPKVAIIGSRKASARALNEGRRLAKLLALEGASIVSGGAIGCDRAAHQGCLDCRLLPAPSIAVMAGGLSSLYPKYNHSLFASLKARQAIFLSERLFEARPRPYDFPTRNRIIAGLCQRIIVLEAAMKSGALVTANLALQYGRDVVALEPIGTDVRSQGSQRLVEDGALCFRSAEDYWNLTWQEA